MEHLLRGLSGTGCFLHGLQGQGQTTTVISDSRGECGTPPLEIPEQKSLVAPNTSEGTTEKDIVVEYHLLLLSLPWEDTHPAAATAKCT